MVNACTILALLLGTYLLIDGSIQIEGYSSGSTLYNQKQINGRKSFGSRKKSWISQSQTTSLVLSYNQPNVRKAYNSGLSANTSDGSQVDKKSSTQKKSNSNANNNKKNNGRNGDASNRKPPAKKQSNSRHKQDPRTIALQKKFQAQLLEMKKLNSDGETMTQSYCDSVLALCVASDAWDQVMEVLDVMRCQGITQQKSSYRACLEECRRVENGQSALGILNAMTNAGVAAGATDFGLASMTLCKNRNWKGALELVEQFVLSTKVDTGEKQRIGIEVYDSILSCMGKANRWRESLGLLELMERDSANHEGKEMPSHPPPALSSYNAALKSCVTASKAENAVQLVLSMPSKGVKPSIQSYNLVISACLKNMQWRKALRLLDVMESQSLKPEVLLYNTVINAIGKTKETLAALQLLTKMRQRGIAPDIFTYNNCMSACAATARWKDALTLLDQCHREPGVEADIITYTCALRACARGGQTKRAIGLVEVMKDRGLKLDVYAYTSVIDACKQARLWRRALDFLNDMKEDGIKPNAVTYSVVIAACGNGGQWRKALELLDEMKEQKIKINVITYNSVITALAKSSKTMSQGQITITSPDEKRETPPDRDQLWYKALRILEMMKADGIKPDAFSYSNVISACGFAGRWREAMELIQTQRADPRVRPNIVSYTSAISACARSGRFVEAEELFSDMKNDGIEPDRVSYNSLIYAFEVGNQPEKAVAIWEEMCNENSKISPDIITVTDVLGTIERSGNKYLWETSDMVFAEAVDRKILLRSDLLDSIWEMDLSGMTFPVAKAACRYALFRIRRVVQSGEEDAQDVTFITGVGKQRQGNPSESLNDKNIAGTSLREYMQQVLREEFDLPIFSTIPKSAPGTVVVKKDMLDKWLLL